MTDNKALKLMYDTLLAVSCPDLLKQLKKNPELYEIAFNNWLDKTIGEVLKNVEANNDR